MTAEDFYTAWKEKSKQNEINIGKNGVIALALVLLLFQFVMGGYFACAIFAVFMVALIILSNSINKKRILTSFESSVITRGMHTICTYDQGLEILNSYEKMFVPWQSIYFVKDTPTHLIILPTCRKGVFAVNKAQYTSAELDGIIDLLRKNTTMEVSAK